MINCVANQPPQPASRGVVSPGTPSIPSISSAPPRSDINPNDLPPALREAFFREFSKTSGSGQHPTVPNGMLPNSGGGGGGPSLDRTAEERELYEPIILRAAKIVSRGEPPRGTQAYSTFFNAQNLLKQAGKLGMLTNIAAKLQQRSSSPLSMTNVPSADRILGAVRPLEHGAAGVETGGDPKRRKSAPGPLGLGGQFGGGGESTSTDGLTAHSRFQNRAQSLDPRLQRELLRAGGNQAPSSSSKPPDMGALLAALTNSQSTQGLSVEQQLLLEKLRAEKVRQDRANLVEHLKNAPASDTLRMLLAAKHRAEEQERQERFRELCRQDQLLSLGNSDGFGSSTGGTDMTNTLERLRQHLVQNQGNDLGAGNPGSRNLFNESRPSAGGGVSLLQNLPSGAPMGGAASSPPAPGPGDTSSRTGSSERARRSSSRSSSHRSTPAPGVNPPPTSVAMNTAGTTPVPPGGTQSPLQQPAALSATAGGHDAQHTMPSLGVGGANRGGAGAAAAAAGPSKGVAENVEGVEFVKKLWAMLQSPRAKGIVEWNDDGEGFEILNELVFMRDLVPKYFKMNVYASFIRQLNAHGFTVTKLHKIAHQYFIRNKPELCKRIVNLRTMKRRHEFEMKRKQQRLTTTEFINAISKPINPHLMPHLGGKLSFAGGPLSPSLKPALSLGVDATPLSPMRGAPLMPGGIGGNGVINSAMYGNTAPELYGGLLGTTPSLADSASNFMESLSNTPGHLF